MLIELTIRNFAVIEETRIEFARGLNALTGETGAGKSIVIDALGAVLGARTSAEFVRSGANGAYIEAVFDISDLPNPAPVRAMLDELGITLADDEPLVLARDVSANGRSTARIAGRTMTAAVLGQLGELLVDIHGQSDHLSLLRPVAQLDLLDRFAGTLDLREIVASHYRDWKALRRRIHEFDIEQRNVAQRLDMLRFQSEELGNAAIRIGEDEELQRERSVLANAERLLRAAAEAESALNGDASGAVLDAGALDRVRAAAASLEDAVQLDPAIEPTLTKLNDALFAIEDVSSELRDYAERTELDPLRLEQVDERLDLLRRIKRKYGPELPDVVEHAERIQSELESIEAGGHDIDALRDEEARLRRKLETAALDLSSHRKSAAITLAHRVEEAITELNMGRANFMVRFDTSPDADGINISDSATPIAIDETGVDRIAFYLAANAGEELRPLARVASGGETARLMLALKSILSDADDTPILVFDEVDVGVGGRSGQVVGEKLWSLNDKHQVIVISHLSQIAAFADRHLILVKSEVGNRTVTTARAIDGADRVEELAAMLDGLPPTPESRANASALLQRVTEWKMSAQGDQKRRKKPH